MKLLPLYKYKCEYLAYYRIRFMNKYQIGVINQNAQLTNQYWSTMSLNQWEELPKRKV